MRRITCLWATIFLASGIWSPSQSLRWKANADPELTGYWLYILGPTNFMAQLPPVRTAGTNTFPVTKYATFGLPEGRYESFLVALGTNGPSAPAGPVYFTNSNTVTLVIQGSTNLSQWSNRATNTFRRTNANEFYRLLISK